MTNLEPREAGGKPICVCYKQFSNNDHRKRCVNRIACTCGTEDMHGDTAHIKECGRFIFTNPSPKPVKKICKCIRLKVKKHRQDPFPDLHCLDCKSTWSDPIRALHKLKTFKYIQGYEK